MLSSVPRLNPPSLTIFSEVIFLTYPHWIDFSFSMFPWPWRWIVSAHQKLMVQLGMDWNYQTDIPSHERKCHGKPWKQGEESVILTHTPYIGRQRPTTGPPREPHSSGILQMPSSFIHIIMWIHLGITAGITVYYFFQSIYDYLKLTNLFTGLSHLPLLDYSRL